MAKVDIVFPTQTPLAAKFTFSHEAKERFEVVNGKGMVIIKKQREGGKRARQSPRPILRDYIDLLWPQHEDVYFRYVFAREFSKDLA
jgi:hypothetical protein